MSKQNVRQRVPDRRTSHWEGLSTKHTQPVYRGTTRSRRLTDHRCCRDVTLETDSSSVARHRIHYNTDPCFCLDSSRVDYCCSLLIGSPRSVTDKLQRVFNAAARVITNTKKYESGLSLILYHDLHWLDDTERIQFRVAATVYQCLHGMAPAYLTELCTPVTASASRRGGLRSVTTSNLVVPRCRLSTYGTRAFSAAGPVC